LTATVPRVIRLASISKTIANLAPRAAGDFQRLAALNRDDGAFVGHFVCERRALTRQKTMPQAASRMACFISVSGQQAIVCSRDRQRSLTGNPLRHQNRMT
jgi:hypothetical protein